MNAVASNLNVKHLIFAGVFCMAVGLFLLPSGGEVALGVACASIVLGMGVDLLIGVPAACVLSYIGSLGISGFVFLGFGFSRLLMSLQAAYIKDKS